MKLCLIGNFGKSYGQICDERHISNALQSLGHEVHEIQREEFASRIDEFDKLRLDATIFFKWQGFTADMVVKWKRITNAPVLAWTFDFMAHHDYFFPVLEAVDLWLGEELGMLTDWEHKGFRFHYFPNHAVPPEIFKRLNLPKEYDVVFSGTPYGRGGRLDVLQAINNKFKLDIFGNNTDEWTKLGFNAHSPMFDEKYSELVAKSKIVIGINCNNETWGYWSIRPAQIMMCGGFTLQKYVPGMEKELKDGCDYWENIDDLLIKIQYYLEHETERKSIADKGYEIAHQSLTSEVRARELIVLLQNYFKFRYDNPV